MSPPLDSVAPAATSLIHTSGEANDDSAGHDAKYLPPAPRCEPLTHHDMRKTQEIFDACAQSDIGRLRHLAASEGGLVRDEVRRAAWPILLGSDHDIAGTADDWKQLPKHCDEDQVQLDVNRSFVYYPEDDNDQTRNARRAELSEVIVAVLRQNPNLHYFQGYHDIVQVLLLILGVNAAKPAVTHLSLLRIRDFMLPTISGTESHLNLIPAILYAADSQLYGHLSQTRPFFALAATLTLYAHNIEAYAEISRLFDYLLTRDAATPVYLFAQIVISRKAELMEIDADEPEMLHSVLSKLPKPLDVEGMIQRTSALFTKYPPETLPGQVWRRVSSNSVLKTTRDPQKLASQTLEDGKRMFAAHAAEIRRAEMRTRQLAMARRMLLRYRRPASYITAAVVVALIAFTFRSDHAKSMASRLWPALIGLRQFVVDLMQRRLAP